LCSPSKLPHFVPNLIFCPFRKERTCFSKEFSTLSCRSLVNTSIFSLFHCRLFGVTCLSAPVCCARNSLRCTARLCRERPLCDLHTLLHREETMLPLVTFLGAVTHLAAWHSMLCRLLLEIPHLEQTRIVILKPCLLRRCVQQARDVA